MNDIPVRRLWMLIEPLHAVLYYAPEITAAAAGLGYAVDTRWPSYFAWRAAPLGAAGPELVTATFYSFSPTTVARYVPAAWEVASPSAVLTARDSAVDAALRHLLGPAVDGPEVAQAAALLRSAAEAADLPGRPLAAANADLPWPTEPHLVLWRAATILREHRGDGHVAALLGAGLDGCASLVSMASTGAAAVEVFAGRGWSEQEWADATDRLAARGWVDGDGGATPAGAEGREAIESTTDRLAAAPWRALGDRVGRLAQLTGPLTARIVGSGILPRTSTLGIGRPTAEASR